jgi:hypothetical protein
VLPSIPRKTFSSSFKAKLFGADKQFNYGISNLNKHRIAAIFVLLIRGVEQKMV